LGFGFAPPNDLESAMITGNLNGAYTAVLDTAGATGISIIEAYDLGELVTSDGGNGGLYCDQYPNSPLLESAFFTLPTGTHLTVHLGTWGSSYWCPCSPPGPTCQAPYTWSVDAVLLDNNFNVVAQFNGGISQNSAHCSVNTGTATVSIPFGATPPYKLRLRGTSSYDCFRPMSINVDYCYLNTP